MNGMVESRMLGNGHVRFGRRPGETDPSRDGYRAPGRPHHAPAEQQQAWLPLMQTAVLDGWADERDLAYLQDLVDMQTGRPQTHATVTYSGGGEKARLWPLADPEGVNDLRAMLNMAPLSGEEIVNAWTVEELAPHRPVRTLPDKW